MTPEDFPQFDDPRVRAVMAAAANLVAAAAMHKDFRQFAYTTIEACQTALFAAQHSKPKGSVLRHTDACQMVDGYGDDCPRCQHILKHEERPPTHEKPIKFDKWGYGTAETNQFLVDSSKPGGKAFIAAIEKNDEGQVCPGCGEEGVFHYDGQCCK